MSSFNSVTEAIAALFDRMVGSNTIGKVLEGGADPVVNTGVATAPAAAAVIADSGALAAGIYKVEITLGYSGILAAGKHIQAEHRNAANAATLNTLALCPAGATLMMTKQRVVIAVNERIRVVAGAVAGAVSEVAQAGIRVYLLPA